MIVSNSTCFLIVLIVAFLKLVSTAKPLHITGLWVFRERHYFVNVNYSVLWQEVDNGRVVKKFELMEMYSELRDQITLISSDGSLMIVLTHHEAVYSRISRASKVVYKNFGKWEIKPSLNNRDDNSHDDDDDDEQDYFDDDEDESVKTVGSEVKPGEEPSKALETILAELCTNNKLRDQLADSNSAADKLSKDIIVGDKFQATCLKN